MKMIGVSVLALSLLCAATTARADNVQSRTSDDNYVLVGGSHGPSENHDGELGEPAIGISGVYEGAKVGFAGLQRLGTTSGAGTAADPRFTQITTAMMPPSHAALGNFNFAQVGSQAVFFGEWSDTGSSASAKHTVYYAGEAGNVATTLPTGTATYSIKSINNAYAASGASLPGSTLTANFGGRTASSAGDINFSGGTISVDGARVQLAAGNVGVNSVGGLNGQLNGDFFGTGAAAVAGTVTFTGERSKNTAFGGAKN